LAADNRLLHHWNFRPKVLCFRRLASLLVEASGNSRRIVMSTRFGLDAFTRKMRYIAIGKQLRSARVLNADLSRRGLMTLIRFRYIHPTTIYTAANFWK
jgi:hypothetical protein